MSTKRFIIGIAIGLIAISLYVAKPGFEAFWVSFMNFVNPQYYEITLKKWSNKPTDFLISKLGHPAPSWDGVAGNILAERKDLSKEKQILHIIDHDSNVNRRSSALRVLFFWDEPKAYEIAMGIVKTGRSNPLYQSALGKMAYRKYEPAYPYVLQLAKAEDRYNNGSISLMEKYGKLESINILQGMLSDPTVSSLYRLMINNAIKSIKEKNGIRDSALELTV